MNSQSLKIGGSRSAPSSVHLLTHCGSISDYGGAQVPQAGPPVAIRGLFSPHSVHVLLTTVIPLTFAGERIMCIFFTID